MRLISGKPRVSRRLVTALAIAIAGILTLAIVGWRRWTVHPKRGPAESETRGILHYPYNLAWGGKETLNPSASTPFVDAISILFDRLVVLDANGIPAPSLALAWRTNEIASIWTFSLRRGVKFHDGTELTSSDVVYTINHILSDKYSPIASTLRVINSVAVIDPYTIVFNLTQADADFPILLADYRVSVLRQNSIETIDKTGLGTGAFKLRKFDPEGTSIFDANDNYWQGRPGLNGIEMIAIADSEARLQALLAGQIDVIMGISPQQIPLFAHKSEFTVQDVPTGNWRGIVMRTDLPPFNDVRVRRALRLAADRQQMLSLILQGRGSIACDDPVWLGDQYHLELSCPQDIEQAKALLTEAGYPDGIDVQLYIAALDSYVIPIAEVYKQQVARAGIRVELKQVPSDTYFTETWMKVPMCATLWAQKPSEQILNEVYRSASPWNESHWSNPNFDTLLDRARKEPDFSKRRSLYQQAQRLLFEDGGVFIPFHLNKTRVYRSNVIGLELERGAELFPLWYKIKKPA